MTIGARVEEGTNLEIAGTALAEELAERIASHQRNAADLSEELGMIRERHTAAPNGADFVRLEIRRREVVRSMHDHVERGRFLDFVRRHLNPTSRYRLTLRELQAFGITPGPSY
jgi:hypothetical protein